jgi:hypothetical protein
MNARRSLGLVGLFTAAALLSAAQAGWAQEPDDVQVQLRIVSASYGRPNATNVRDFSKRLQQTCGDHAVACQSFCSRNVTGAAPGLLPNLRIPYVPHPVCRVIYRCGEGLTRATETDDGDIIALNCKPR